jgi:hypothetical protein
MSQATPSGAAPQSGEAEKPKTLWEKVVTSTPIILTVVATVLAGKSSAEMTQAQYHRALAAQEQSKVSDQWNFFQAKKIRGTSMEMTNSTLRAMVPAEAVNADAIRAAAARLPGEFALATREARRLAEVVKAGKGELGADGGALEQAAGELEKTTASLKKAADEARARTEEALKKDDVQKSFAYLGSKELPVPTDRPAVSAAENEVGLQGLDATERKSVEFIPPELMKQLLAINPAIPRALAEVLSRQNERQMEPTLKGITTEEVARAIEAANEEADRFDKVGEPVADSYRTLDGLLTSKDGLTAPVRAYHQAAAEVAGAVAALPAGDTKALNDVRLAAAAVARTDARLKAVDDLSNAFKAATIDYNARRYRREALYNQTIASLYELDVRKASLESDRYVQRSKNFFYAMLAAQAGVTIATFALAVRYRSLLWGVATAAGLAAVTGAAYILFAM